MSNIQLQSPMRPVPYSEELPVPDPFKQMALSDNDSNNEALLNASSEDIFRSTRGRASFKKISILIPDSWVLMCPPLHQMNIEEAKSATWSNADLIISQRKHSLHGSKPWTLQTMGCGHQGDYISIGYETLLQNDTKMNGRLLAHSWIKYRYGVFDEVGIDGSTSYPPYHRNIRGEWVTNACTNSPLRPHPLCNSSDVVCGLIKESPTGMEGVTGSFMAYPQIESTFELCDEGTHNPSSPTPHNLICGAKSVWEVLRASQDFQNNRNVEGLSRPENIEFTYIRPKRPKMVLLVENTNVMNVQKRWDFMRKAVRKFVNYDVPDGFEIGLVVFASSASRKYPLKSLSSDGTRENLGSSLPRNPSREDKHRRCILCGLEESIKVLEAEGSTEGSHIVLVLAGSGRLGEEETQRIKELILKTKVILHIIIYPLTEKFPQLRGSGMEEIGSASGGVVYAVPDEGIGSDSKIIMYYNLLDALYHILNAAAGENALPVKIYSEEHKGGFPHSKGSFWIDEGLGLDTVFEVFYYDLAHVGDSIHLINPNSQVIDTANMQNEDDNMNMISIHLKKNQEAYGLWHYELENRADSHQSLFVQVTSRPQVQSDKNLQVRAWTNHNTNQVNLTDKTNPLIIFTEIRSGMEPIKEAKVTAILLKLGTKPNGTAHSPIHVPLHDNGLLNPDINEGDGVYSRYLFGLPLGKYSVTVQVEGQFDGSKYTRYVKLSMIEIIGESSKNDVIAPPRITNLRATVLPSTDGQVSFAWTATGDDYDYGQAKVYKVLVNHDLRLLRDGIGIELEDWPRPLPSHSIQQHTITWKSYDELFYLALSAIDSSGNVGPLSNVVEIFLPSPSMPESTEISPHNFQEEEYNVNVLETSTPETFNSRHMIVVFGCLVGFLVLLFLFAIFYCSYSGKNKRTDKEEEENGTVNVSVKVANKTSNMLQENELQQKSEKQDYLKPITSWSPSELLGSYTDKRRSISEQSDINTEYSDSTKKQYGDSFDPLNRYNLNNSLPYDPNYDQSCAMVNKGYKPSETYLQEENEFPNPQESYSTHPFPHFDNSQPDSFSESCDILPVSQGPPGYPISPMLYECSSPDGSKIPPPIPPKPNIPHKHEAYIYEEDISGRNSSNGSVSSDRRVRNVTMV
ncbi:Calcium-activated chloride channel regulator 2 [Armadillidium nasatum]|uniref:Calcium-activated chloride channel regulator 2 n=1 Tax=Armadillidium nasatum TaxID=96803 RepID=A0A5N5TK91_9CRUS|nr:Calcium-activated chloride channel regulator 2 [Armadillidium nasatum]